MKEEVWFRGGPWDGQQHVVDTSKGRVRVLVQVKPTEEGDRPFRYGTYLRRGPGSGYHYEWLGLDE